MVFLPRAAFGGPGASLKKFFCCFIPLDSVKEAGL